MSFTEIKRREIKNYLLRKIDEDDASLIGKTADAFGISATSVKRYLDAELAENHIFRDDSRACGYLLQFRTGDFSYDLAALEEMEDSVIYDDILPMLDVNENAGRIWRYTLPEMLNNAIEHSQGSKVRVHAQLNHLYSRICITDDGIGIFINIIETLKKFGFKDPKIDDAVAELYKGKFTSIPERHTGEGIFFTMRLLDKLAVVSGGTMIRSGYTGDVSVVKSHLLAYAMKLSEKGTVVIMQLENDTKRDSGEVFNTYADVDEGFIVTRIPVFEACLDRDPVARSQARRICLRLDSFKEAVLDFAKVEIMGQGFADEVFRVYAGQHPDLTIRPVNMNAEVQRMYLYSINNRVDIPRYS